MSAAGRKDECPRTDQTLAVFLDGVAGPGEEPGQHLRHCPDCQRALRRARRLDASLANHSAIEVDDAQAERIFTAALPALITTPEPAAARALPVWTLGGLATGMLALGLALGLWIADRNAIATTPPQLDTAAPAPQPSAFEAADPTLIRLPASSRRKPGHRDRALFRRHPDSRLARLQRLDPGIGFKLGTGIAELLRVAANPLSPRLPSLRQFRRQLAERTHRTRIAAGQHLLGSRRESDRRGLLAFLGAATATVPGSEPDPDPVRDQLLAAARDDNPCRRWLLRRLQHHQPEPVLVRAAARLGTPRIDASLRRILRRQPLFTDLVLDAVQHSTQRPLGIRLLLDLWHDLESRHGEIEGVSRWFRHLPGDASEQLLAIVHSTSSHPDRRRALLALAWRRDADTVTEMLALVAANHHENSLAAGFVLSQLPADRCATPLRAALDHSRRPYVVLAALFGMGSALARDYAHTAELSPEEADFLLGGHFSPAQFSIAARLCKRRRLLSD